MFADAKKEGFRGGDLQGYNEWAQINNLDPIPFCFYIIDETAEMMSIISSDFNARRELLVVLDSIARLGRSTGLSLFISSQTFTHINISKIESHCNLRMSMKLQEKQDSRSVLGPNNFGACEIENKNGIKHVVVNSNSGSPDGNVFVQLPFDDHPLIADRLEEVINKWPVERSKENPDKFKNAPRMDKKDPSKKARDLNAAARDKHSPASIFDNIPLTKQNLDGQNP